MWSTLDGTPVHSVENQNLTPELFSGLRWVAENTPRDAVFAIDTHHADAAGADPRWCYFTALAERRAWAGCAIAKTFSVHPGGDERVAVSDRIYAGDRRALQRAVDDGVSFVAVDLVHGEPPDRRLARQGRLVFDNGALLVYDVRGLRRS